MVDDFDNIAEDSMADSRFGSPGKANLLAILAIVSLVSIMVAMVSSLGYHYVGHQHLDHIIASLKADTQDAGVRLDVLERKSTAQFKEPVFPTGAIVAYWGAGSPPDGWLFCNGMSIDRTENPEYAKLVTHLNRVAGKEAGDTAKLPDLRGVFLRGLNHTGTSQEKRAKHDPDTDRTIGDLQEDKIARHIHRFLMPWQTKMGGSGSGYEDQLRKDKNAWREHFTGDTEEDFSEEYSSETRPVNVAVNFIIKI
jgi:hypothetical protein